MNNKNNFIVFLCLFFYLPYANAVDVTGRLSTSANISQTQAGELGYSDSGDSREIINNNQQSFRLMLQDADISAVPGLSWVVHEKLYRQNVSRLSGLGKSSSDFFRYEALSNTEELSISDNNEHYIHELDIATISYRYNNMDFSVGRQAIDWGTGRFWQPMNVFGAFAPTDLDTDYKAGIDSVQLNYYPSAFSSLDMVVVFSPRDNPDYHESYAAHYKRQLALGELSLLLGKVLNNEVQGLALESEWQGIGLRVEGVHYKLDSVTATKESALFWIAGADYHFDNGTLVTVEYYHNGFGTSQEGDLTDQLTNPLFITGIQPYMSRQMLGLSLNKDLNPLLNFNYSLLTSELDGVDNKSHNTYLHQLSLVYSLNDNSDILFSLLTANGKHLDGLGLPHSEFGQVPDSFSFRLRYYF